MIKSYKYRIYPTEAQRLKIDRTIGVCRFIYNLALETKIRAWESARISLSTFALCRQLPELKKDHNWIKEADSQALQASVKNVEISFKNFFIGKGYPKFKSKRNRQSFQCPNGKREIDWDKSMITIPKIKNIPIVISRIFEGEIKNVTISKSPTGKYFASVLVKQTSVVPVKQVIKPETAIGIDLGIKSFVVTSDGKFFESNRKLKNSLKRLQCLQRRASRKKKGSNNRKKANKCVAILHEKITNQRTDYIHKTTSSLVKGDNQTFVIEDLNVVGMLRNHSLAQSLSDVSFGEFFRQMKYKCDWYGKSLITIGRFEPSSKMCSACGSINEDLTLADREWTCTCGVKHDRDLNAAINIRNIGLNKYSGRGTPGEPVESSAIAEAKKQESCI